MFGRSTWKKYLETKLRYRVLILLGLFLAQSMVEYNMTVEMLVCPFNDSQWNKFETNVTEHQKIPSVTFSPMIQLLDIYLNEMHS